MRKFFLATAVAVALVAGSVSTAGADGSQSVPYTCPVESDLFTGDLEAAVTINTSDSADPIDIFEPVTFTATVTPPPVAPPIDVTFDRFEIELFIPDGFRALTATLSDPTSGPVANPPLSQISTVVTPESITIELPKDANQGFGSRIRAHDEGTGLTYPANAFNGAINGTAVIPPVVTIQAMPTFAAADNSLDWLPPEVRTGVDLDNPPVPVTCTADEPQPIILSTNVTDDLGIPDNGYSDTPDANFADPGIDWGKHMGIIVANFPNNAFKPLDSVNRGQIVNMLWNMMDRPTPTGQHPFTAPDIPANAFYETALDWAFSEGLVTGFPNGTYKPKDPVNRQQLMSMLYQLTDAAVAGPYDDDNYTDGPTNATFIEPIDWANVHSLINEFSPTSPPAVSGTQVKPKQAAKRGEVAYILHRVASTADAWNTVTPSTVLFATV